MDNRDGQRPTSSTRFTWGRRSWRWEEEDGDSSNDGQEEAERKRQRRDSDKRATFNDAYVADGHGNIFVPPDPWSEFDAGFFGSSPDDPKDSASTAAEIKLLRKEIEKLRRLLRQRNVENRVLTEKIEQLESKQQRSSSTDLDARLALFLSLQEMMSVSGDDKQVSEGNSTAILNDMSKEATPTRLDREDSVMSFNEILEEPKDLGLLGQVLPFLLQQRSKPNNGSIDWKEHRSFLQTCRLVCKSWKRDVDHLLESHPSHHEMPNNEQLSLLEHKEKFSPCPVNFNFERYVLETDPNRIPSFTVTFKEHQVSNPSYNPIPSRHLKLDLLSNFTPDMANPNFRHWNRFSQDMKTYLEAFGRQVWYLTVGIRHSESGGKRMLYGCLFQWLRILPNLRTLALSFANDSSEVNGSEELKMLEEYFSSLPLPQLERLRTYQMEQVDPFFGHLLLKNCSSTVGRLGLIQTGSSPLPAKIMETKFPNLSELSLVIDHKENLIKLGTISWKLRKLSLTFHCKEKCSVASVIGVVEKFKNTLESLTLDISHYKIFGSLGEAPLNLSHLKHFIIRYRERNEVRWENLLSGLSELETLEFELDQIGSASLMSRDKLNAFWAYFNNVHRCKFWLAFQKLKEANVIVKVWYGFNKRDRYYLNRPGMPRLRFNCVVTTCSEASKTICQVRRPGTGASWIVRR